MDSTAIQAFDLFASDNPTLEQIKALEKIVNSSEKSQMDFLAKIQSNLGKNSPEAALANGIGFCLISKYGQAIELLEKAKDGRLKFVYLAEAMSHRGRRAEAVKYAEMAGGYGDRAKDSGSRQTDDTSYTVDIDSEMRDSEYYALLGDRANQKANQYDWREVCKNYRKNRVKYVNLLCNAAVRLEDCKCYDEAEDCVNDVLAKFPNHKRAKLFKKDIRASREMVLDEDSVKRKNVQNKMLDTPISDFELSVRSRNCLKKMNIHTVGDLLRTSESQLLSYKNFGETSLREIKAILDSKNLRLGMAVEQGQPLEQPIQPEQDNTLLTKSIDELRLSVRARKCLDKLNLRTLGDLVKKTEAELLGCKNFGVTSLNEIKKAIELLGLSLRSLE